MLGMLYTPEIEQLTKQRSEKQAVWLSGLKVSQAQTDCLEMAARRAHVWCSKRRARKFVCLERLVGEGELGLEAEWGREDLGGPCRPL